MNFNKIYNQLLRVLVQPRKTRPDITEKNVDWDVNNQIKQTNQLLSENVKLVYGNYY